MMLIFISFPRLTRAVTYRPQHLSIATGLILTKTPAARIFQRFSILFDAVDRYLSVFALWCGECMRHQVVPLPCGYNLGKD